MSKFRSSKSGWRAVYAAGIPFIAFLVGGSYFLSTFLQTHVEMKDELMKPISKRKFDIEEEHKKLLEQLDTSNFTLSRIPRPDEKDKKKKGDS